MHIGTIVPQGWKGEFSDMDGPAAWAAMIGTARSAERLGYDSIWLYDHFHAVPPPAKPVPVFECWTGMAALAAATQRVRIGQMVTCAPYRNPALLAKITSCVDVASGGRLEVGLGAGWYRDEFDAYDYPFPSAGARIGYLEDTVEILKRMWSDERATYEGRYAQVRDALCDPKPVQRPRPPLWIGGAGRAKTLRVVAKHADYSNFSNGADFAARRDVLHAHCKDAGRDPAKVRLTIHVECMIAETESELARKIELRPPLWGEPVDAWRAKQLVGTPEQVIDQAKSYVELGCSGFILWFPDSPSADGLELFARDVAPALRASR